MRKLHQVIGIAILGISLNSAAQDYVPEINQILLKQYVFHWEPATQAVMDVTTEVILHNDTSIDITGTVSPAPGFRDWVDLWFGILGEDKVGAQSITLQDSQGTVISTASCALSAECRLAFRISSGSASPAPQFLPVNTPVLSTITYWEVAGSNSRQFGQTEQDWRIVVGYTGYQRVFRFKARSLSFLQ